jgi:predicted mannosyl-3-phosphoglycerate phosphatase (HAD superfamily)
VEVTGYAELSIAEVAALTGLDEFAAARARQRDYSETLVDAWPAEAWRGLAAALAAEGFCCRPGGRFHTVTSAETDKGRAVRLLTERYVAALGRPVFTVGLGDSENDEGMLFSVDRPYLLPKADRTWAPIEIPGLRRMARPGALGWHDAIVDLLASDLSAPSLAAPF